MIAGSDNVATELLDFFGEENLPQITDKYTCVLNHTQAQKACIRFLRETIHDISGASQLIN